MNISTPKEKIEISEELSIEALQILEILDQIENHTAILRKKLVSEFKPKSEPIRLKLDNI
jgi:hypothetical protein